MTAETINQKVRTIIEGYLDMSSDAEQARQSLIALGIPGVTEEVSSSAFLATCLVSHNMGALDDWLGYYIAQSEAENETWH